MGTIAAFLAWFGGAGYLATSFYGVWFLTALGVATVAGLFGGSIVFWFVSKVLMRGEQNLDPAAFDMIGVLGTVTANVREGGTGEIIFSQNGVRRSCPDSKRGWGGDSGRSRGCRHSLQRGNCLCPPLGRVGECLMAFQRPLGESGLEEISPDKELQSWVSH